ncbi:hypothetical protein HII17_16435 [Thalassotalea sp. M1531]|uniref:Uncharacterized protein n=2 Tax=Thalassotalea algicola TaxID=2716224 RepID=A0A7Y0LEQ0_9GAMM|nr:hypothetical protein [Thalassotalea algicola]
MKTFTYLTCVSVLLTSFVTFAEPSANHSSKASKHSALAVSHGAVGSAQVASAAVAIPLVVTGSVALSAGAASVAVADGLSDATTSKARNVQPAKKVALEVTEITITVDRSPDQAMKANQ